MSTYDDDSLLSQFNRHVSTDWYPVSATLCSAVEGALDIAKQTDGAFDITLGRVVNLWGFGPDTPVDNVPENPDISAALDTAGYRKLHTDCSKKRLRKDHPGLYVDLSAYAKGLAADLVGKLLAENDIDDYLVEIGGEIRTSGLNGRAEPWRVAIELPDSAGRAVEAILHVSNLAVATSGDYRNYFEVGGVRYSHAIDGRTGAPVTHSTSSVTVVNESAAVADSLATALLVMGHGQGLAFAEANGIAAVFIVRKASGFETLASPLATPYLD
jgi:thiamine biosynthesis lipoprotein